ncbi:Hypothetical protein A7982_07158 [Minicystis rosea]|nr:Hypothetical protein A7982_07158 [Minicystis rosea]
MRSRRKGPRGRARVSIVFPLDDRSVRVERVGFEPTLFRLRAECH